jgi:putative transposase
LAIAKQGCWSRYTLQSAHDGHVAFDLAVVCHNTRGQRGRHQRETLLDATWGMRHRPLSWIHATYRGRFGIESSYRQVHQARIRTSSRNPVLRLVFVGVALTLRNVWVWLHAEVMAVPRRGAQQLRPEAMRFACLLLWLMMEVVHRYRLLRTVSVYRDVYERANAFGIIFNY